MNTLVLISLAISEFLESLSFSVSINDYFDIFVDKIIDISSMEASLNSNLWITDYDIEYDYTQNTVTYSNNEFELTNKKISADQKGKYILIGRGV